jgi:hypothetical protein
MSVATAIVGGVALAVGLNLLLLVRFDKRFGAWIHPCMFDLKDSCTDEFKDVNVGSVFVVGPLVTCGVFAVLGLVVQCRLQADRKEERIVPIVYQPIPHGYSVQQPGYFR